MSEVSSDQRLGPVRELREDELRVIRKMLSRTGLETEFEEQLAAMKVQDYAGRRHGEHSICTMAATALRWICGEQIAEAACFRMRTAYRFPSR